MLLAQHRCSVASRPLTTVCCTAATPAVGSRSKITTSYSSNHSRSSVLTPTSPLTTTTQKRSYLTGGDEHVDVLCIGGGVMSASVGLLCKLLEPSWNVKIIERLESPAMESSEAYNNAGTGHAAYCELNYTSESQLETGEHHVEIAKALDICEKFHVSKQWWAYLTKERILDIPVTNWLNHTPHLSFVHGDANVAMLKRRYERLKKEPLFSSMEFTEDEKTIAEWAPLIMDGRQSGAEKLACTRVQMGTDNDWGALTGGLIAAFERAGGTFVGNWEADKLRQNSDGTWTVHQKSTYTQSGLPDLTATGLPDPFGFGSKAEVNTRANFVFVGAGGASLQLLQKAKIPEIAGYGGFPVSGQFFVCRKPEVVCRHSVKCYGKAAVGSPPMSVPHLDRRYIRGEELLLFGPYAGFSPNFLKHGSPLDLISTVNPFNVIPMVAAGGQNIDLSVYLAKELASTKAERMQVLREFFPNAQDEDWSQITAGQRVQIMKEDKAKVGIIQFGTEIIQKADRTISGLMGASPGASVSVQIALDVVEKAWPDFVQGKWKNKLEQMIPGYKKQLNENKDLYKEVALKDKAGSHSVLGIPH
ncbi:unnamed protein product [Amoebophrya sp. A120]|nr:unnamed protein product [Amoebophrya sp. A120]|eukprot:GSA120T00023147001.1